MFGSLYKSIWRTEKRICFSSTVSPLQCTHTHSTNIQFLVRIFNATLERIDRFFSRYYSLFSQEKCCAGNVSVLYSYYKYFELFTFHRISANNSFYSLVYFVHPCPISYSNVPQGICVLHNKCAFSFVLFSVAISLLDRYFFCIWGRAHRRHCVSNYMRYPLPMQSRYKAKC